MEPHLASVLLLATEGGLPYDSVLTRIAFPVGVLIFLGLPYMLLRSNLGTKRAYLVMSSSLWGFMFLISLFWGFGAPGTPALTGPTNLPGTTADAYRPIWVPFAPDSTVAEQDPYAELVADESRFTEGAPEGIDEDAAVDAIKTFFAAEEDVSGYPRRVEETWQPVGPVRFAEAANGQTVALVTLGATYQQDPETGDLPPGVTEEQVGQVIPEGEEGAESFTSFAFFDPGSPRFPSFIFLGVSLLLFVVHMLWLYLDEQGERRERQQQRAAPEERVPAGV
jgi:hypothetical protein